MEPYVELACSCPVNGFTISLSFNVILVIICSYYAFKTRTLPDNFNESRYITLCVYTTLLIWLAFLPSFFTATLAFYELILLSSALLLNASVILICLYTPRIYAIYSGKTNVDITLNSAKKNTSVTYQPSRASHTELGTDEQRTELDLTDFGNTNSNSDSQASHV
jgi:metabotropic glutamate receptor 2/3/metabotropic glutamate receptor 6/7/8